MKLSLIKSDHFDQQENLNNNLDNATIHTTHRHVHKKVKKVKLEERRRPGDQVEDKVHHEHDENDDGLREVSFRVCIDFLKILQVNYHSFETVS